MALIRSFLPRSHGYNPNALHKPKSIYDLSDEAIDPSLLSQAPNLPEHHDVFHADFFPGELQPGPALNEFGPLNSISPGPSLNEGFFNFDHFTPGPEPPLESTNPKFAGFALSPPQYFVLPKKLQQQSNPNKPAKKSSAAAGSPSIIRKSKRKACSNYTAIHGIKCEELFSNQKHLDNHIRDAHHLKVHKCNETDCDYRTARLDNLSGHMRSCKLKTERHRVALLASGSSPGSQSPMISQPVRIRTSRTRTSKQVLQSHSPRKPPLSSFTFDTTGLPTPLSSQSEDPHPSQQDTVPQSMNDIADSCAPDDGIVQNETGQLQNRVKTLEAELEKAITERNFARYKEKLWEEQFRASYQRCKCKNLR